VPQTKKKKYQGDETNRAIIQYTWKCHKETHYVAFLNKQKNIIFYFFISFTKSGNRRVEQVLPGETGTLWCGEEVGNGEGG
jgi:hypothetical protein